MWRLLGLGLKSRGLWCRYVGRGLFWPFDVSDMGRRAQPTRPEHQTTHHNRTTPQQRATAERCLMFCQSSGAGGHAPVPDVAFR